MRKLLALITTAALVSFSGCASKSAAADSGAANAPVEKEVSAYLNGAVTDVATAKSALESVGFKVVGEYKIKKIGTSLVFTNDALTAAASKEGRGHAAVLRMLVDDANKQISITNPVYFGKAFLQDDYNHETASAALGALNKAFPGLKMSEDKWEFDGLGEYHFMMGMPYYQDQMVLAEGDTAALLEKAKSYKKGKLLVFEYKISETATLLGYELGKKTSKFVKKTGSDKAEILPYTILVENGKATAMAAKFYIAVSYPLLSMGEFMTIATIPGAVEKDLKKPFK